MKFGTEAQKQDYLPRICRGEVFFCIGMSEPNSGSDLASLRTRATFAVGMTRLGGQHIGQRARSEHGNIPAFPLIANHSSRFTGFAFFSG